MWEGESLGYQSIGSLVGILGIQIPVAVLFSTSFFNISSALVVHWLLVGRKSLSEHSSTVSSSRFTTMAPFWRTSVTLPRNSM